MGLADHINVLVEDFRRIDEDIVARFDFPAEILRPDWNFQPRFGHFNQISTRTVFSNRRGVATHCAFIILYLVFSRDSASRHEPLAFCGKF
jgi:hypothetical protein